jgi:hypothetical protein
LGKKKGRGPLFTNGVGINQYLAFRLVRLITTETEGTVLLAISALGNMRNEISLKRASVLDGAEQKHRVAYFIADATPGNAVG